MLKMLITHIKIRKILEKRGFLYYLCSVTIKQQDYENKRSYLQVRN